VSTQAISKGQTPARSQTPHTNNASIIHPTLTQATQTIKQSKAKELTVRAVSSLLHAHAEVVVAGADIVDAAGAVAAALVVARRGSLLQCSQQRSRHRQQSYHRLLSLRLKL
jgi:hypothetical protein